MSVLACNKDLIVEIEKLKLNKNWNLAIAAGINFGATTLKEVIVIVNSEEYKRHTELFTSETLAHAKLEDIQKMLQSEEYKKHPELFTSTTLSFAKLEDIQKLLHSEEYMNHPELFTSTTLSFVKLEDIQKLLNSEEYRNHPELFTSQTLANAKLEDIQRMLQSEEYKNHPELFTATTLAHAKLEDIQKILHSEEYKNHPELFTSQTLVYAKLEDISKLLQLPYWNDIRFKRLLTSSIVAKSKQMLIKLPSLIQMAEYYKIDEYLTISFLLLSPSHNFALINYLNDNNIPLIANGKLSPVFSKQASALKKNYGIDIKEQMRKYDFSKFNFAEKIIATAKKSSIR